MKIRFNINSIKICLMVVFATAGLYSVHAQRSCATLEVLAQQIKDNPELLKNMELQEELTREYERKYPNGKGERVVITIPTVFHIVYNTSAENISDAQIQSQLDVLNLDFSATNLDLGLLTGTAFQGLGANVEIQFCMAQRDPAGNATNGIVRVSTSVTSFSTNDAMKFSGSGGSNIWDRNQYLNIWVCDLGNGLLGYAQFPGGTATTDGVVLDYEATGTIGTALAPFNKGRTATHEVGHWLNLRHIWGDATCGSDLVSDTPVHNTSNYGCPTYPHYSTCTGSPVEMTMNYMDYTDDACMYMFSPGQKTRMRAVTDGGQRNSLASSQGCTPPSGGGSCGVPSGLAASNIQQTQATCSWGSVTGATSYIFEIKLSSATTWTVLNTTGTSVTASGLTSGATYNVRVKANCSGGSGNYSAIVNFTTVAASCTDNFESNNSRNQAKTIPLSSPITARIASATDVDWVKFTNTTAQRNIRVSMTNLPADYDMELYRGAQFVARSENENTADELIIYNNNLSATTYNVKVYGYNGANSQSCYSLLAERSSTAFSSRLSEEGIQIDGVFEPLRNELAVFPNPASNNVSIVLPVGKGGTGKLELADVTGRGVFSQLVIAEEEQVTMDIDASSLQQGLYILRFEASGRVYTSKLIVTR
jgi:hypothetical protein